MSAQGGLTHASQVAEVKGGGGRQQVHYAVYKNTVVVFKEENGIKRQITAYHCTRFQFLLMLPISVLDKVRSLLPEVRTTVRSEKSRENGSGVCEVLALDNDMLAAAKRADKNYSYFTDAVEFCATEAKSNDWGSWRVGINVDFHRLVLDKEHSALDPVIKDGTHFLLCGLELPNPPRYPNLDVLGVACSRNFSKNEVDPSNMTRTLSDGLKYECAVKLPGTDLNNLVHGRFLELLGESVTQKCVPVFLIGLAFCDDCDVSLQAEENGHPFLAITGKSIPIGDPQDDLENFFEGMKLDKEPPPRWNHPQTRHLRERQRDRPGLQTNRAMAEQDN